MGELHEAFTNAGSKDGLEIWRIEDFNPVSVPESQFGSFYSGDSYIVLKTTEQSSRKTWDIHFWLGSETSQDEAGAAAILTVNLDDGQFQGSAVQHREVQGYESRQFLNYFNPGIRYMNGGHASGFNHVTINPGAEKRLFHIKGKRNVRVKQVKPSVESLNNGDCFILDAEDLVFVFIGQKALPVERLKANMLATHVKDQDHNGRATLMIHEMGDSTYADQFYELLGGGSDEDVADAEAAGDDEEFEHNTKEITLSEISDRSGEMEITKLSKPYTSEMLNTEECYILDTGSYSGIYVWVGKASNKTEKAEAMKRAEFYLKKHNYPDWVHVTKVPEGIEPLAFSEYFESFN